MNESKLAYAFFLKPQCSYISPERLVKRQFLTWWVLHGAPDPAFLSFCFCCCCCWSSKGPVYCVLDRMLKFMFFSMNKISRELELVFSLAIYHSSPLRMVQIVYLEELHYRDCKVIWASNAWHEHELNTDWLVNFQKADFQRYVMNVSPVLYNNAFLLGALEFWTFRDKTELLALEPLRKHG